jgi:hypothetical protein
MCSRWEGTRRRAEVRRTRALAPARRDAIASFGSSNSGESSQPCYVSRDRAQVSRDILPDFWSAGGRAGSAGCPERDLTSATAWPSWSPSRPRRVDQSMDRSGVSGSGRLSEFGTRVAQGLEVERRTLAQPTERIPQVDGQHDQTASRGTSPATDPPLSAFAFHSPNPIVTLPRKREAGSLARPATRYPVAIAAIFNTSLA